MKPLPKESALSETPAGPVAPSSRIVEIDMVRGFALFGVLLVNMYNFGAESIAWDSPMDQLAFSFMRTFAQSKSWILFSLLFGLGFAVQLQRCEARGGRIWLAYLRRLVILFVFGAAHALLFDGDILMLYAELGLGLLLVRDLPWRWLLVLAFGLMMVFPLYRLTSVPDPEAVETIAEAREELEWATQEDVYAIGTFTEVLADNSSAIPALPLEDIDTPESGLAVFAMFLIGYSLGRSGVLRDIPGHLRSIAGVRNWGLALGVVAMAVERCLAWTTGYAVFRPQQAGLGIQFGGDLVFAFGTLALALGYAATIILAAQIPRWRNVLMPLAGVGRLGLTVYLTQSIMFTTLFYGYGFGQVFRMGPVGVTFWAVVFFGIQIVACHWWLKRYRFGPMEWLWRSLTYLQWQPLRRSDKTTPNV